jgi:hypothetical protein
MPRPSVHRRLAAWLLTGPVGFLVAGVIDWVVLVWRYVWARARGHEPWA